MAEEKKGLFPLFPGRPRILPEKPEEKKSGPLGLGVMEQIPKPLKDLPRPIQDRRPRLGER